jgi:hypothetical protein
LELFKKFQKLIYVEFPNVKTRKKWVESKML